MANDNHPMLGKITQVPPAAWQGAVSVTVTRARQTEPPASPFRDILAGGVSVLMSGARIATHVLGVPSLAAAIHDSRVGAAVPRAAMAASGPGVAAAGGTPLAATMAEGGGSDMAAMQAMQRESQVFNLQLLELQEQIQQENRRFTTVSNVLRAKHDTAKAAVSNIRG
jgi:hypothetical protein